MVALCIDAMLPALSEIGVDLNVDRPNDSQFVISSLLLGLGFGQILYGPFSDRFGRKPAVYLGLSVFLIGCLVSAEANRLSIMLLGRVLQGLGLAAPRIVCMALIRDCFKGNQMARIMSYIMLVFIITPILAPSLGQIILVFFSWRVIFWAFLFFGLFVGTWFAVRQPETLKPEHRQSLSFKRVLKGFLSVVRNRIVMGYTLAMGLISGAFLGYLNLSQPILQIQYGLESQFSLAFGVLAGAIGGASVLNSRLVMRFGMRRMTFWASLSTTCLSFLFAGHMIVAGDQPTLMLLMLYLGMNLFCIGILFGNMNSLAMEPLGHIAGTGAAVVGFISTLMGIPLGMIVGFSYQNSVLPLILGFGIYGSLTTWLLWSTHKRAGSTAEAQS